MKKCLPIIFAALLTVNALTGCAGRNSSPEQNNATVQSSESTISQPITSTTGASSPTVSPNASAAYEKLIAYKTEGYEKQSMIISREYVGTQTITEAFIPIISEDIRRKIAEDDTFDNAGLSA